MSQVYYERNLFFMTTFHGINLEDSRGWTPDCGHKQDYDPSIIHASCRVYPDGNWVASIWCGFDEVFSSGHHKAADVRTAKSQVEEWVKEKALKIRGAVEQALQQEAAQ